MAKLITGQDDLGFLFKEVYSDKGKLLTRIEFFGDTNPEKPDGYKLFRRSMREFEPDSWGTIIFDSGTSLFLAALAHQEYNVNPVDEEKERGKMGGIWRGGATDMMEFDLINRVRNYQCNVVLICHTAVDKVTIPGGRGRPTEEKRVRVEMHDALVRSMSAPGRLANRGELASQYSEVYRLYADGEGEDRQWHIQTEPDGTWVVQSQIPAPAWSGVDPHYRNLWPEGVEPWPMHYILFGDPGGKKSTLANTFPSPRLVKMFDSIGKEAPYLRSTRKAKGGK